MAAMCHANRGIGYKMHLPWPSLKKDYVYFTGLVSTFKEKHLGARKIIHIRGRLTWTCCREQERCLPNVYHIIVSRTCSFSDFKHPRVLKVVPSFEDAVTTVNTLFRTDDIDSVWIMGGSSIYQASINHPQCNLIYLTHVYTDFPADTFFPEFKDKFQEIHDHPERGIVYEDKGVKFEFKVYKKISSS